MPGSIDQSGSSRAAVLLIGQDSGDRVRTALSGIAQSIERAASTDEALHAIGHSVYGLVILTNVGSAEAPSMQQIAELRAAAAPTPLALLATANVPPDVLHSFAFTLTEPFSDSELCQLVSKALQRPLLPTRRESEVIREYFRALADQDWEALGSLCDSEVVYHLPAPGPFGRMVVGRDALLAYAKQTFPRFPGARFDPVIVYELGHGHVARYLGSWIEQHGKCLAQAGSASFRLRHGKIVRIGVELDHERLEELAGKPELAEPDASADLSDVLRSRLEALATRRGLTPRERQVLGLMVLGRSSAEIGVALGISARTAKFHVANLLQKLGADSRKDLLRTLM